MSRDDNMPMVTISHKTFIASAPSSNCGCCVYSTEYPASASLTIQKIGKEILAGRLGKTYSFQYHGFDLYISTLRCTFFFP